MIPIHSIKAGVDYTLQHIYLPPLSKLGVLMLSRYMPYGNIFQLATGRGAIAVKGSWVLMKTEVGSIVANLQKQHTEFLLHQKENEDSILFPRNPRDSGFKIMFTGPMDRWNRLIGLPGSVRNSYNFSFIISRTLNTELGFVVFIHSMYQYKNTISLHEDK